MNIDEIRNLLSENVVEVQFTKVDGSLRVMRCTNKPDMVPSVETNGNRKVSTATIAVYDLENSGYRSFRVDSVKSIKVV